MSMASVQVWGRGDTPEKAVENRIVQVATMEQEYQAYCLKEGYFVVQVTVTNVVGPFEWEDGYASTCIVHT